MKKCVITWLLIIALLSSFVPVSFAANSEEYNAAGVLYDIGLFSGTGTKADGSPEFDLDRVPTRNEAVTMLVRLLGKDEEAKNGSWDIPFDDVAEWAKPYVGYAYAHGLTSGTSATTFGGTATITASQYLTFVLRALGYDSSKDFAWDRAWELSDKIGMTDGRYKAGGNFVRGDVAIISRNALDTEQKDSKQTLADKLIADKVFTKNKYKESAETPWVLKEQAPPSVPVTFLVEGEPVYISLCATAGTYTVTPFWNGERFNDYELEIEFGSGRVSQNGDGTFDVKYDGKDALHISLYYDIHPVEKIDADGKKTSFISKTKRSLSFNPPVPDNSGLVIVRNSSIIYPDKGFGDNYSPYFVVDVYYNGVRLTDYTATAAADANFTAKIQADGSLLLMKNTTGSGNITISWQGKTADFRVVFN
ncbi:MAG: S-layer homology domain-containing protein [Clostridia bacterium]|nr:S-layer homology domain-containing protein [Clostridia bacterium]